MADQSSTRAISNSDFGISFPTADRSRRSTTRSPHALRSNGRRSKTPVRSSREASIPRSRGTLKGTHRTSSRRPNVYEVPEEGQTITSPSSKRRRLNDAEGPLQPLQDNSLLAAGATTRRSVSPKPEFTGPDVLVPQLPGQGVPSSPPGYDENVNEPPATADKENESPLQTKSQPRRKKRKSIGQQSVRRKKRSSTASLQEPMNDAGSAETPAQALSDRLSLVSPPRELGISALATITARNEPRLESESARTSKNRRKRKSIVLGRKKRRSSDQEVRVSAQSATTFTEDLNDVASAMLHDETSEAAHQSDEEASPVMVRRPGRGRRQRSNRSSSPRSVARPPGVVRPMDDRDEEEDATYIDEELSPEPETPVIVRKPRRRASTDEDRRTTKRSVISSRPGFQILTHRLTNARSLPTIVEEGEPETESEGEHLSHDLQHPDRAPNAVDVLAQYCREFVDKTIDKIDGEPRTTSSKAGAARKRTALEAFGSELDTRLFDMSQALEHRLTLEARIRKSKREKADLEAQWLEIRRQRNEIALKTDAVRRRHWRSEADRRETHELSQHLHDLEMMVERDEEGEEDGLEYLLQDVAGCVSNTDGGNLLARIKAFNQQLERTAAVLDARN